MTPYPKSKQTRRVQKNRKPRKSTVKTRRPQRVYIRFECGCYLGPLPRVGAPTCCEKHQKPIDMEYAVGLKRRTEHDVLVELCDIVTSNIIRRRDGYQCVLCGSREEPQCGHVIVRGKMGTRYNLRNMYCLCATHNVEDRFDHSRYTTYFLNRWGLTEWQRLVALSEGDISTCDLRAILEHYETLLERMNTIAVFDDELIKELGLYG